MKYIGDSSIALSRRIVKHLQRGALKIRKKKMEVHPNTTGKGSQHNYLDIIRDTKLLPITVAPLRGIRQTIKVQNTVQRRTLHPLHQPIRGHHFSGVTALPRRRPHGPATFTKSHPTFGVRQVTTSPSTSLT